MSFNKDELEIQIKVLRQLLKNSNPYQKDVLKRLIAKLKALLRTIETGGMGE